MKFDKLVKILCSFPLILLMLYWNSFFGICLIILRFFFNRKREVFSFYLIMSGFLLLIPRLLSHIFKLIDFDGNTIPYFKDIIDSDFYTVNCITYSKLLITIGLIYLIVGYIIQKVQNKIKSTVINYIGKQQQMEKEIFQKNDLLMQEKRERALNTHIIHCSYCGAENILSEKVGVYKYCRRKIE